MRYSLLTYGADVKAMYASANAFEDLVGRYQAIGISEFIIYYPWTEAQHVVFEEIANDVIPRLRNGGS